MDLMNLFTLILAAAAAVSAIVAAIAAARGARLTARLGQAELDEQARKTEAALNAIERLNEHVTALNGQITGLHEAMRTGNENQVKVLESLRGELDRQMERIRATVDEKLQKTLDERVTQSFKVVSDRLEAVYKSLGEMKTLADGVGELQRALSNVKTRGILGEVQLSRILEQMLTPTQYLCNVCTKKGSRDPVEFAIKIPSKGSDDEFVLLPIDAKFPLERYSALQDAYDGGDAAQIKRAATELRAFIRDSAKKIRDKYIDPPHTTDFAILFLPTEGLYAEVIRETELVEELARKYNVTVSGPSTISALLNSLQMGFRTLAIEKRSAEVWKILGAVKTEFSRFDKVLAALQTRLDDANKELDKLVTTRTRMMMSKLKGVDALPDDKTAEVFPDAEGAEVFTDSDDLS